ncbi:hypothetical protein EYF80_012484 [Liparis tanakae]|uniref:Uncharacterized protein n=1 Tax=Liparis tanakae TaxID=230148 RepID=A0A4Z2IHD2_9TELE|nr:hypothetical protein EYF80_012484 [Liparis tanakae]
MAVIQEYESSSSPRTRLNTHTFSFICTTLLGEKTRDGARGVFSDTGDLGEMATWRATARYQCIIAGITMKPSVGWQKLLTSTAGGRGRSRKVFVQISTTNLHNDFFDALERFTSRFVAIFKSKKGSVGETLAELLQQIDLRDNSRKAELTEARSD